MIGRNCSFHIPKGGQVICKGRIIIDDETMILAKGKIQFGQQFGMNKFSRIVAHEKIEIGDFVTIGQMVSILDHDHAYQFKENKLKLDGYTTAPIKIGNNIWIGDKCTILKGVTIGNNVVIAAHTLVNKDVPSNVIIGGNPQKILKEIS
ncbi:MAG: acyltransferase [Saprospiraceae bacterium]